MTNIGKTPGIGDRLGEGSGKEPYSLQKKQVRETKEEVKTFGDIYDVRFLAEINRSSAKFKLAEAEQVNAKLREILKEMDNVKTDEVIQTYPSEDIIELSKMAKKQ